MEGMSSITSNIVVLTLLTTVPLAIGGSRGLTSPSWTSDALPEYGAVLACIDYGVLLYRLICACTIVFQSGDHGRCRRTFQPCPDMQLLKDPGPEPAAGPPHAATGRPFRSYMK
jgi:hypothetical protein